MTCFTGPRSLRCCCALLAAAPLLLLVGCGVPQPRGKGLLDRRIEPTTSRGYWLYLPESYVAADETQRRARPWPLVVTFHGMKPFDNARPQALEWEDDADRYGFIVIAPELRAPDVLSQFPVRSRHPAFVEDERCSLAIINHVIQEQGADGDNVLSTSWSSGGYMAHYMLNQHPEVFTCLAVRQSNFSEHVLDSSLAARSLYHPVLIVNTENDFGICRDESRRACEWYQNHGYRNWGWVIVRGLGHERTPDVAASFFAQLAGVQPAAPNPTLARRQAIDGNASGLAVLAGTVSRTNARRAPAVAAATPQLRPREPVVGSALPRETPPRPADPRPQPRGDFVDGAIVQSVPADEPAARSAPPRVAFTPAATQVGIRVSSAVGVEPLHLGFSADCPSDWQRNASFLWTLNGDPLCSGVNGQKTITTAGEHTLGLLVVAPSGAEYRASRTVRVLPQRTVSIGSNNAAMLDRATP